MRLGAEPRGRVAAVARDRQRGRSVRRSPPLADVLTPGIGGILSSAARRGGPPRRRSGGPGDPVGRPIRARYGVHLPGGGGNRYGVGDPGNGLRAVAQFVAQLRSVVAALFDELADPEYRAGTDLSDPLAALGTSEVLRTPANGEGQANSGDGAGQPPRRRPSSWQTVGRAGVRGARPISLRRAVRCRARIGLGCRSGPYRDREKGAMYARMGHTVGERRRGACYSLPRADRSVE